MHLLGEAGSKGSVLWLNGRAQASSVNAVTLVNVADIQSRDLQVKICLPFHAGSCKLVLAIVQDKPVLMTGGSHGEGR